jgi:membrane-bound lytic murein transglycosylase D
MPVKNLSFLAALALLLAPLQGLADGALVSPWSPSVVKPPAEVRAPQGSEAMGPALPQPAAAAPAIADGELTIGAAESFAPSTHMDVWGRIRAGFQMDEIDSPLVQRHEAWYLNRPDYLSRMVERSRRYLYFVLDELEKRNMPSEIALLPMIESAYNPVALSPMRAAGIWQFIPSTGKRYGLKQNWWYDGRRDVLAATRAALDYLQELHTNFGDWELALAAYNWGEGGVQRAIDKNRAKRKPTDYPSLDMPRETRNYLPKLQAVKNIISDPALYGIELESIPNRPYFTVVNAPAHIDVAKAAELADMSVEEFRSLNPAHTRPVITPVVSQELLVPVDKAELFHANLESNDEPLVSWQTYQLKKGETVDTVARKFGISVQRLKEVNGLNSRKRGQLRPGQMVLVPTQGEEETNLDETYNSADFQAPVEDFRRRITYRVRRGDTLAGVARKYRTSPETIKAWNHLRSTQLHTGQRLTIWQDGARPVRTSHRPHPNSKKGKRHIVARG